MIDKIIEFIRKYTLPLLVALGVALIGSVILLIVLIINDKPSIEKYKNDSYAVAYDNSWKVNSEKDNKVIFEHDSGSKLSIDINNLVEEYEFSNISDFSSTILQDIKKQNKKYKLIYQEESTVTKNNLEGYRILFENDDSQVMVVIAKKSDQFVVFVYEAKNKYFDILLDSVQRIIYEFEFLEEKFDLKYDLNVKTKSIEYKKSDKIVSTLKDTVQYQSAYNNYLVKYSVPSRFEIDILNSNYGYYEYSSLEDEKIELEVKILNRNIYEYVGKDSSLSVFDDYKFMKKDKSYSDFKESIDKLESKYNSYIYKCSYYYNSSFSGKELNENIVLIYSLDVNHILVFEISSRNVSIPKELVDMIKIDSVTNYSSYTDSVKKDGLIYSTMKKFTDYKKTNYEEVVFKIPDKYKEVDTNDNLYENRSYKIGYNDKLEIDDYEIEIDLNSLSSIDSIVEIQNSSLSDVYGEKKNIVYTRDIDVNGKVFKAYLGGTTRLSGIDFTNINRNKYFINQMMLFYKIDTCYVVITIKGNGKEISDDIIKDVTNFEVNKK